MTKVKFFLIQNQSRMLNVNLLTKHPVFLSFTYHKKILMDESFLSNLNNKSIAERFNLVLSDNNFTNSFKGIYFINRTQITALNDLIVIGNTNILNDLFPIVNEVYSIEYKKVNDESNFQNSFLNLNFDSKYWIRYIEEKSQDELGEYEKVIYIRKSDEHIINIEESNPNNFENILKKERTFKHLVQLKKNIELKNKIKKERMENIYKFIIIGLSIIAGYLYLFG